MRPLVRDVALFFDMWRLPLGRKPLAPGGGQRLEAWSLRVRKGRDSLICLMFGGLVVNLQLTFWYAEAVGCDMETENCKGGRDFSFRTS